MGNPAHWSQQVAARVHQAVKGSGLSNYAVAKNARIANATFDRLIHGVGAWDIEQLERIAQALDLNPNEFVPSDFVPSSAISESAAS